jgi:hypothetical protein
VDRPLGQRGTIEYKLAAPHLKEGALALYDLSSWRGRSSSIRHDQDARREPLPAGPGARHAIVTIRG